MTFIAALAAAALLGATPSQQPGPCLTTDQEKLGRRLFFDAKLSANGNVSCATCHAASTGRAGPLSAVEATGAVYEGSIPGAFGNRKPPTAAYAGESPRLHRDEKEKTWVGGMFWDGRATGARLDDPLAEQAQGPFLDQAEHALPDAAAVVARACKADYAPLLKKVIGKDACAPPSAERTFDGIGRALAAWERSREVNPFTSKYDAFLAGTAALAPAEQRGLALFEGERAKCSRCHPSRPREGGKPPLFTDFTYDNLGLPRNPMNPFYRQKKANPQGAGWVDMGLGGALKAAGRPPAEYEPELGKFKVPTLRNVDLRPTSYAVGQHVRAYGHNGVFKSLEEVVHFYNTRDVKRWDAPEFGPTVNQAELGNLKLTEEEEADLVAFLRTLSDGWMKPTCR